MEHKTLNTMVGRKKSDGMHTSMLPSMNLSNSSDAMKSIVSWCRILTSQDEPLSTGRHKHVVHELHYVYEGELCFHFDHDIICGPGEYIFIPSGIVHSIEDNAPFTRKLVIGFEVASRNEIINEVFSETHVPVTSRETPVFHELALALKHKSAAHNLTTSVSIACIVHTLLLELVDSLAANTKNKVQHLRESVDCQRIDQILSFINENMFNGITVDDVANAVALSPRQASRICRHLFGCTLNELIVRVRLKEICALLIESKYSIAEIAEIAGFASPYSFSRHFSRYTGVTPSSYRRNYEIHH